jgi:acyl-CoA-dependent ceramide synthase
MSQVILFRIPNATSPEQLWGTYPTTHLPALTKFYYLAQFGWWFHQIYVINSEKQRKDHWQMFGHHVLTIVLISTSYVASFTRVGTLIHVLMDFCDIFLPVSATILESSSHFTLAWDYC